MAKWYYRLFQISSLGLFCQRNTLRIRGTIHNTSFIHLNCSISFISLSRKPNESLGQSVLRSPSLFSICSHQILKSEIMLSNNTCVMKKSKVKGVCKKKAWALKYFHRLELCFWHNFFEYQMLRSWDTAYALEVIFFKPHFTRALTYEFS